MVSSLLRIYTTNPNIFEMENAAISLELSTQERCDGSAKASIGNSTAIAGVYGPLESRITNESIEGSIDISFKAHISSSNPQEDADFSLILKDVLERSAKNIPRTTITISVRVLADEGCGMSTAMMAAVGALVDSGVPLIHIPVGIEVTLDEEDSISFYPPLEKRNTSKVKMFLVFCGDEESPCAWISTGPCSESEINKVVVQAREYALNVRKIIEKTVENHVRKDLDLCVE